jgi:hypothetical protein
VLCTIAALFSLFILKPLVRKRIASEPAGSTLLAAGAADAKSSETKKKEETHPLAHVS